MTDPSNDELPPFTTCTVGGIYYLVHPEILGKIQETISQTRIRPVTVLATEELMSPDVDALLTAFDKIDDVFCPEFGWILIEHGSPDGSDARAMSEVKLAGGIATVSHLSPRTRVSEDDNGLPSGPYFLVGQELHKALRLYPDELDAFLFGVIPDSLARPTRFYPASLGAVDGICKSISVPSRLYNRRSPLKPLAGERFAISDEFLIAGIKTTMCSKAWAELSEPAEQTSKYVQTLLDLGAAVVGKTKIPQFGCGSEWVDFRYPGNPRGDGYRRSYDRPPSGGAAAVAGYDWLEYAVGIDGPGDALHSAACFGVYGIRLSPGLVSLSGTVLSSPRFDGPCLFTRDMAKLRHVLTETISSPGSSDRLPSKIVCLTDPEFDADERGDDDISNGWCHVPDLSQSGDTIGSSFLKMLQSFMETECHRFRLKDVWEENPPDGTKAGLQSFLGRAFPTAVICDNARRLSDFYCQYGDNFGRRPFLEKVPRERMDEGGKIPPSEEQADLRKLEICGAWLYAQDVFHDMVMVYPPQRQARGDQICSSMSLAPGINRGNLIMMIEAPLMVIPFSQEPSFSDISGKTEYLPVCAFVMGSPGSDHALMRLVHEAFGAARWRTSVETGRSAFPP